MESTTPEAIAWTRLKYAAMHNRDVTFEIGTGGIAMTLRDGPHKATRTIPWITVEAAHADPFPYHIERLHRSVAGPQDGREY